MAMRDGPVAGMESTDAKGSFQDTVRTFSVHPAEARAGLKKVDTLIPLGVVAKHSKLGGQHVHQLLVSCLWHPGLPVRPHRVSGWPGDPHHSPTARNLPLFRRWFTPGHLAGPRR